MNCIFINRISKKILATTFFICLSCFVYSEELQDRDFFFTLGANLMVNTDDSTKSAPSPIMYSLGFGADLFQTKPVSFETKIAFFTNYYLWDGEKARPAEIENRTATALSFMIDVLGGHIFKKGDNYFYLYGGLGILARFGILSSGVDSSASEDVSSINSSFYSNMNFLYPEISFKYLRSIPQILENFRFGGEFKSYFPLGSLTTGNGIDSMIFSLAAVIQF